MNFTGVILAGGKSSRMKRNKALLKIQQKTFIETIADQLQPFFDEIIIVTNTPDQYDFLPYDKYPDIFPEKGPLGGLYTGLIHGKHDYVFVTACDMPFVDGMIARELCKMAQGYDGAVPSKDKFLQPLFAAYKKDCIPYIEKCLAENQLKIPSFYPYVNILYKDWNTIFKTKDGNKTFFNVNTPEDLELLQKYKKE